ncbi:acetyltransferase [Ramlibacter sp.]|uniref:acetyltransferase n=1 Tax=Ramlibacter sp. TaxID=1917967 RepID=UPI0035B44053
MQADSHQVLLILGAGGHGRVVADAALRAGGWTRVLATDRDPARCSGDLLPGVLCLPIEAALEEAGTWHVAIGDAASRVRECGALGARAFACIIHPGASVSPFAHLAPGCLVAAGAVVAPGARIGEHGIVNHGAVVDHDCDIGPFCHLAPQSALGGGVRLGRGVMVGSGARVLPGLEVADDVVIGAGAVVHRSIREVGTYVGVPARRMK